MKNERRFSPMFFIISRKHKHGLWCSDSFHSVHSAFTAFLFMLSNTDKCIYLFMYVCIYMCIYSICMCVCVCVCET